MTSTAIDDSTHVSNSNRSDGNGPLEWVFDPLVSLAMVLVGLLSGASGVAMYWVADRELAERIVAEMTVESTLVSTPVLEDTIYELLVWGGIGLTVVGLLSVLGGVAFLVYRRRLRRRDDVDATVANTPTAAVIGGVVTVFASFVPFSPVVGGVTAGYLRHDSSRGAAAGVGALAGTVTAIPLVVVGSALVVGAALADAVPIAALVAVAIGFSVISTVGLSALGGWLGAFLAEREA